MADSIDQRTDGQEPTEGREAEQQTEHFSGAEEFSLQDELNFDPFARWEQEEKNRSEGKEGSEGQSGQSTQSQPGQDSPQSASEAGKQEEAGQQRQGQDGGQQGSEQRTQLSEADQLKAQLAEMRRTNELLQQRIDEAGQQGQNQDQQKEEQPKGPSNEEIQRIAGLYNVPIADNVMSRIQSDKPEEFQQGLHQLVQGIGFHTHQQVMQDVQRYVSESVQQALQQNVPQLMQQHTQEQSEGERVRKDFYGTYPQFDKPELHQLVRQTSGEVANELGISKWSPVLRDETAKAMAKKLEAFGVPQAQTQGQGQQQTQTANSASQPRSFDSGQGTRGSHTPPDHNSSQEIGDVLFNPS